jgi:hypothetical protein
MATQYFRVTVYHPGEDLSAIFDSHGLYEKLWQFSSFLIQKGFKVLEVSNDEKFLDVNIAKSEPCPDNIILRAAATGMPENVTHEMNGIVYHAIRLEGKIYIPDRDKRVTGGAA